MFIFVSRHFFVLKKKKDVKVKGRSLRNVWSPALNTKVVKDWKRDKVTELLKEIMVNATHKFRGSLITFWQTVLLSMA